MGSYSEGDLAVIRADDRPGLVPASFGNPGNSGDALVNTAGQVIGAQIATITAPDSTPAGLAQALASKNLGQAVRFRR